MVSASFGIAVVGRAALAPMKRSGKAKLLGAAGFGCAGSFSIALTGAAVYDRSA